MAGFDMTACGMYPIYNNQIAMSDLYGIDYYTPMCGINPMMTMNGSIFGGGMIPGMIPGMMPGMMPGYGGNYEDYYKQYERYQDFMIDNQVRMQQKNRNADLRLNSPLEGTQTKAVLLHEKIMRNEQQQIRLAYDAYLQSVKDLYGGNISEQEAKNRASALYSQLTGLSLPQDIRSHGRDSFTQGFLQTVTLGFADQKTAEENVADLTGQPVGRKENMKKFAGNIAGGALFGGAAFCLTKPIIKGLAISAKSKTFWGLLIGAVAGLGAALATSSKS